MGDRGNVLLRWADRYLGIPLVWACGLGVRKKPVPEKPERIGILATAAIGDSLLLSPVLKDLQKALPQSEIVLFCGNSIKGIMGMTLEGFKLVIIPVKNPFKAARIIRREKFDLFIDCGPWPRLNSLLAFFSHSSCRIGFNSIKQYRHYVYHIPVDHRNDCHELENLRRLIAPLGIKSASLPVLGQAEPSVVDAYAVVHMFPSGYKASFKEWSDDRWIRLIDGLTKENIPVFITGGPADGGAAERIISQCRDKGLIRNGAGKYSLKETGEYLRKATLVVSVNTGIMHMAAAYGQALIALHGPTSVLRWGPVSGDAINFCATTTSAGCLHLGFEYDKRDPRSLDTIDPDEVLKAALELWAQRRFP
ncbi:MAG: glycosyltransferase family 9 protein [Spirochaetales bacterium]|nr:glycosyltransferase family 9 protein [Spirochaetales bacterium]